MCYTAGKPVRQLLEFFSWDWVARPQPTQSTVSVTYLRPLVFSIRLCDTLYAR